MLKKGFINIIFNHSITHPSPNYSLYSSSPPSPPRKSFSDSIMEENIEIARSIITKWDPISNNNNNNQPLSRSDETTPLFSNTRQEAKQYLNAVKNLQSTMQHLIAQDSSSEKLLQAQSLMQVAMKRLQKEFYRILADNSDHLDPESVSSRSSTDRRSSLSDYDDDFSDEEFRLAGETVSEMESVPAVAMADLKAIADCMIPAGYGRECVKIYMTVRKSIVDEALYKLGVEKLSLSRIQKMQWEVLELKIKCWLNAVKVAVGTLFHGERTLCDHVFASPERKSIAESCFAEVCKDGAAMLFGFPENVAKCKKTPEKMFRTLDLYEVISDNWPKTESIFSFQSTSSIRMQAVASQVRLAEAVRAMLSDFESAIQKESSKVPVPGGAVHPLTRYVMNYLAFLADYSGYLGDILADSPKTPLPESYYRSPHRDENPSSEIAERMAWLILVLLCKLDGKAELCNDVALAYLFLANNMRYVVVKVRKSNLGFLLGDEWLSNHEAKVKEYALKYERVGWSKVLSSLPENPSVAMPAEQASAVFRSFNDAFHEAIKAQSSWIVPDPKLRDDIKVSIASKLVPKYREFYEKNRVGSESAIGYLPDDMGNYLADILYGVGDSGSVSSHSSSHCLQRP